MEDFLSDDAESGDDEQPGSWQRHVPLRRISED